MKKIKNFILMLLLVLMVASLTGCGAGATVNTTLTINQDMSGTRTMQMVFAESVFNEYFSGTIEELNNIINNNIPAEMSYDYTSADGNYYYQFYLNFSSIEDYSAKINTITGAEYGVVVTCPDSIWVSGIFVEEDFTSSTLLTWLSDALVESGQLSSSYVSNLFGTGDTVVLYNGFELSSSTQIYVDEIDYQEIDRIEVFTDVNTLDTYNRTVKFVVPNQTMLNKGEQITEFMNSVVPENGTIEVVNNENGTEFVYRGNELAIEEIETFMKSIFGQENVTIAIENVNDMYSPFTFSSYFNEQVSLANYIVGNVSTQYCNYIKSNDALLQCSNTNPFISPEVFVDYLEYSDTYPEYLILDSVNYYGGDTYPIENSTLIQRIYSVDKVDVSMKKNLFSDWTREIEFILSEVPTEDEVAVIESKVESKYSDATEESGEVSSETQQSEEVRDADADMLETEQQESEVENAVTKAKNIKVTTNTKEGFNLTIKEVGTAEEIGGYDTLLFGSPSYNNMYTTESGLLKLKKIRKITDKFNLGNYVENKTPNYVLSYTLDLGAMPEIVECNLAETEYLFKSGEISYKTDSNTVDVSVLYKSSDIWSVGFALLIILMIVLMILACVRIGVLTLKKTSEQKAEIECNVTSSESCVNCGGAISEGVVFGKHCGHKVGKDI